MKVIDGESKKVDVPIGTSTKTTEAADKAKLCKLERGRPSQEKAPIGAFKTVEAADKAGVGTTTMDRAMKVDRKGTPELVEQGGKVVMQP